jgi:hypothetical protein
MSRDGATRNMAFASSGNILVALHTTSAPSHEEWGEYMQALKRIDLTKGVAIAFSDGGGPSSAQRKLLNETLKGRALPAAVVTRDAFVRSIVRALAWFNPLLKDFSPERTADAFEYLKLTKAESETVRTLVQGLHTQFTPLLKCVTI